MILGMLVVGFVFGVLPVAAGLTLFQLMLDTQAAQTLSPVAQPLRLVTRTEEWVPPSSTRPLAA